MKEDAATRQLKPPLFDRDIECPKCGYNLRGQTEPRCPECGSEFDPEELLAAVANHLCPPPSIWWTIPNVLLSPRALWTHPQVRNSPGPGAWYLFLVLAAVGLECSTLWLTLWIARSQPLTFGLLMLVGLLAALVAAAAGAALVLHMVFCLPVMPRKTSPNLPTGALAVVGYSAVWVVPALAGLLAILWHEHSIAGANVARIGYLLLAASCLPWMLTLYAGGMAMTNRRRAAALWCAASNPIWYLVLLLLWALQ